jgi:hypothetical protein
MSLHCCRWFVALLVASTMLGRVAAQETPAATESTASATDSETTYHDLRRSKNRATKSAADRYFFLIRAQEWTSLNGKSKITAKYVAHDPDLKWVKLSAVKGSGADRVTREITVDVAKLNKACQSRVKQIDLLQKKLDELKVKEAEGENAQSGGAGSEYGGYGAPMRDERGAEPARRAAPALPDPTSSERGAEDSGANDSGYGGYTPPPSTPAPAPQTPPAESSDPDPLGFGEVANEPPPAAAADPRTALGRPPAASDPRGIYGQPTTSTGEVGDAGPAEPVDRSQWKTSYAAFLANFTATPVEQGEPTLDWGELGDLRGMHDTVAANLERGVTDEYGQHTAEFAQRLGEVRWSAPFTAMKPTDTGEQEVQFDLPPLPEPLKLRFLLDATEAPDKWTAMRPGENVEFIGRFDVKKANEIIIRLRLPE